MLTITTAVTLCMAVCLQADDNTDKFTAANLESAYKGNDYQKLDRILGRWARESKEVLQRRPRSPLQITATVEDIYTTLCETDLPADDSAKYFVVPETISVILVANDFSQYDDPKSDFYVQQPRSQAAIKHADRVTINDFAPRALSARKRILLSDEDHFQELLRFLAADPNVLYQDRFSVDSKSEEGQRRSKFLKTRLPVEEGAWGLGWTCRSEPGVSPIYLNGKLDEARVRVHRDQGGEIFAVRKRNGKWVADGKSIRWFVQ